MKMIFFFLFLFSLDQKFFLNAFNTYIYLDENFELCSFWIKAQTFLFSKKKNKNEQSNAKGE